ncbi:WG repeat protein [Chitinophaga skermanii]|uniref:WG repeat protein n=1 Tax=Chitinophaga skermanii TaxID=331697 RepID=A0A327Q1U4_9BACT|nr:WG repeat-containing protein [Chitinophaga skermanii]RAI97691.1 WG repeat protein [Chitinophaga skermanii]
MKPLVLFFAAFLICYSQLSAQLYQVDDSTDLQHVKELASITQSNININIKGTKKSTVTLLQTNDSTVEVVLTWPQQYELGNGKKIDVTQHFVVQQNVYKYWYAEFDANNIAAITQSEAFLSEDMRKIGSIYCSFYFEFYARFYLNDANKVVMEYRRLKVENLPPALQKEVRDTIAVENARLAAEEEAQREIARKYGVDVAKDFSGGYALIGMISDEKDFSGNYITRYAFIDTTGYIMQGEPYFTAAESYTEHYALVRNPETRRYQFLGDEYVMPMSTTFQYGFPFSEGCALIYDNNYWGFIDTTGYLVTKMQYYNARSFSDGMAAVMYEDKWGYVDKTGKEALILQFNMAHDFKEGYALVGKEGDRALKYYYITKNGEVAYTFSDNEKPIRSNMEEFKAYTLQPSDFHNGVAIIERNGRQVYIDSKGKEIVRIKSRGCALELHHFVNGFARVKACGKWGLIARNGDWVVPPIYDGIGNMYDNRVAVIRNGNGGFADSTGRVVINPQIMEPAAAIQKQPPFTYVSNFSEGLAVVQVNEKYGYIDKYGNWFIKPTFEDALPFKNGFARVIYADRSKQWKYIRRDGIQLPIFFLDPSNGN